MKADTTYVDSENALQDTVIGLKADTTYVDTTTMQTQEIMHDLDLAITLGSWSGTGFTNMPTNATNAGTVVVAGGKDQAPKSQFYTDSSNKLFVRYTTATDFTGVAWNQMGIMTFDDTTDTLSITL